jgi:hypothetical protein
MTTTGDLISATERLLLSGDREQLNRLTTTIDADDMWIVFDFELDGIQPGAYVALDLEILYVWSVDVDTNTALVQRGMVSSTAASHTAGTVAFVNPKFSKFDILNAINVELDDLSPELFQVKAFDLTTLPVSHNYTVPDATILQVLEVAWLPPGAEVRWARIPRTSFSVLRGMPLSGEGASTTGVELKIAPPGVPGRPMRVRYATSFDHLSDVTEDAHLVSGLATSSLDIPPLGAAARLMGVREAKRTFVEAEVDTRRANEVPPGATGRAAQLLYQQVASRIKSEAAALRQQWPAMR